MTPRGDRWGRSQQRAVRWWGWGTWNRGKLSSTLPSLKALARSLSPWAVAGTNHISSAGSNHHILHTCMPGQHLPTCGYAMQAVPAALGCLRRSLIKQVKAAPLGLRGTQTFSEIAFPKPVRSPTQQGDAGQSMMDK